MTANKRTKMTRLRGTHTHKYGGKKKHRGAGSRGGRGMAGTGKKGDVKKPSIATIKNYFGVHGFHSINRKDYTTINLNTLVSRLPGFIEAEVATKKGDVYVVDLSKTKYTKLLGSGSISVALEVSVATASARAIEKVAAVKGKVTVTEVKKVKKAKQVKAEE